MKRVMMVLTLVLVLSLHGLVPAGADILYLNEGEEHVGLLDEVTSGTIRFTVVNGSQTAFLSSETAHILISKIRPGDEVARVEDLTDPVVTQALARRPQPGEHPHADYVTLFKQRRFAFKDDGTIVYDRREIIHILKEPGLNMANRSIYYIKERENCDLLFSHTYAPDGHVYHVTDDAISDEALNSSTPEYARLRKLKFAMKKVDLGSVIDYSYRMTTRKPSSLKPYLIDSVFGQREPTLHEELVVVFPKKLNLESRRFQWEQVNAPAFRESVEKGTRTWTWTFKDPKGFIPEQNMMSTSLIFPRLMVYEADTWEAIAEALAKAVEDAKPDPALLAAFLDECGAASGTTPLDKARRVYEGIIRKIRMIGLNNYDMGGADPIPVDVALKKRYGNNMARVTLLYHGLKTLGMKANIGLISNWDQGGVRQDVINLGQAPYGIIRIEDDGEIAYTCCSSDYLPFGIPLTEFQGASGCFLDGNRFFFEKIPEGKGGKNRVDQMIFAKVLPDGTFEVNDVRSYRGPFEVGLRTLRAAKEREISNFAEQRVKQIHPNAQLLGYTLSNVDNLQAPAVFSLQYRIPEAALRASDQILAFRNLWLNYSSRSGSLATRTYPMEYWTTLETTTTILFELPESFVWVPWNKAYEYTCGCVSYQSSLHQTGKTLVFADRFQSNRKEFDPQEQYQHYRRCILAMSELANQWVVVEKPDPKALPDASLASETATDTTNEAGEPAPAAATDEVAPDEVPDEGE